MPHRKIHSFVLSEKSGHFRLFNYVQDKIENKSNFYLCTFLYTDEKRELTILTDGSNSYRIWLNGEILTEVTRKHNTNKVGDRFLNVSLKEGNNLLFVKINRAGNVKSWDFIAGDKKELYQNSQDDQEDRKNAGQ